MKKLVIIMCLATVAMAVAAAALVAAVRYAADTAPEVIDSALGQVDSALEDAVTIPTFQGTAGGLGTTSRDLSTGSNGSAVLEIASTTTTPASVSDRSSQSGIGPAPGTAMAVVGVRWDDVLNMRDAPNGTIVARLVPILDNYRDSEIEVLAPEDDTVLAIADIMGVIATGQTKALQTTVWHYVEVGGIRGWVSDSYLAPVGGRAEGMIAALQRRLDEIGSVSTVGHLEDIVAKELAALEPGSNQVLAEPGAVVEGTADFWIDVIDVHAERRRGYRVEVWAQASGDWMVHNATETAGPFTSPGAIVTELCLNSRGTDADGRCR